jgi:hypothetical protein
MHWVKWSDLARPKACGRMGFKDFTLFNKAMLAKQGWRLIYNPESLCARFLKGKYYNDGNFIFLEQQGFATPSPIFIENETNK